MKVQIVYLSASDDIDSTRDLLRWVQTPRTVLVWPDRGSVLHRNLDLVLLKRYAQRRHLAVGLLTFDSAIRQRAAELGFPLFESLDDLPEERWKQFRAFDREGDRPRDFLKKPVAFSAGSDRSPDWVDELDQKSSRVRLGGLLLVVVLIGSAFLPSAEIILSPPRQIERATLELELTGSESQSDRFFAQIELIRVQGSAELQTTGQTSIPVTASKGRVRFTNLSPNLVSIPRYLGIRSEGVQSMRFQTTSSGELAAEIGAEIELPIEAVAFGEDGNLPAGTVFSAEAAFGLAVAITNPSPIRGGSSETRPSVAAADLARLEETLVQKLLMKSERELAAALGSGRAVLEKSASVDRVLAQNLSHGEGEPTQRIKLDLDLNIRVMVYERDALFSRIQAAIAAELESNRVLIANSVIASAVQYFTRDENSVGVIRVQGSAESYVPFQRSAMLTAVRGRTRRVAQENIEAAVALESPPGLVLVPSWLPFMPYRIVLRYDWKE